MQIRPLGGVKEVGRSCFLVEAGPQEVLVDCGIKQSVRTEYPALDGINTGQIDAVFLTHAHVDHIGALPVLEARGLLADDAPILATRPTDALATIMLWDSLKLHKMEARERNVPPQYQEEDVENVLARIEGHAYEQDEWTDIRYEFGNAGHLLGSAWLTLEHDGARVLFSGDLGGRSGHLPDIAEPPQADALFLESTYGDTLTHPSFSDARTDVFQTAVDAAADGVPVLIPTFGMGRAQELLQVFREREPQLPEETPLVFDGLIEDSMRVYHAFASDSWIDETILNYKINSGDTTPFLPERAHKPGTMERRETVADGEQAPIIISPSGMLTGGWAPWYLWQFTQHYEDARLLFVGYQAAGTPGRQLLAEPNEVADVTISALMYPEQADRPREEIIGDRQPERDPTEVGEEANDHFDFYEKTIEVPTDWIRRVSGLSGHADANTLLQFARTADPEQIHLVHGAPSSSAQLREHIASNADASTVRIAEPEEAIDVTASGAVVDVRDELTRLKAERDALAQNLADLTDRIAVVERRLDDLEG